MKESAPFRLVFDASDCDGWGMCAVVFPEGISLDRWGFAQVTAGAISAPEWQRKARRAVGACPRRALTMAEVPGGSARQASE